jgi:hypothetical protein
MQEATAESYQAQPAPNSERSLDRCSTGNKLLAVEKQAKVLLMPVSARRGLNDLPDDLWTKISIESYKDPEDAVFMGLEEQQTPCDWCTPITTGQRV